MQPESDEENGDGHDSCGESYSVTERKSSAHDPTSKIYIKHFLKKKINILIFIVSNDEYK